MGVGSWVLAAIVVLGLAWIVMLIARRKREERVSIYDRSMPGTRSITGSRPIVHPRHS